MGLPVIVASTGYDPSINMAVADAVALCESVTVPVPLAIDMDAIVVPVGMPAP